MQESEKEKSNKPRILCLYFSYFPSTENPGPAESIRILAERLQSDFEVHIITHNYDGTKKQKLFKNQVFARRRGSHFKVSYVPRGIAGWRYTIREISRRSGAVTIHCFFDYRLAIPILVIGRLLFPRHTFFHFPHGIFLQAVFKTKVIRKWLYCRFLDLFDMTRYITHIAASPLEERDLRTHLWRGQEVVVIPHFRDQTLLGAQQWPAKKSGSLKICLVGRVAKQKNVIGALDILDAAGVPCECDIYGDTSELDYFDRVKKKADALVKKGVVVRFLGFVKKVEMTKVMPEYDLLFSPTLGENYGHAIVEALALGVPVLLSDQTPWTDVGDTGAGWAFPLQNIDAFVQVLKIAWKAGMEWDSTRRKAQEYVINLITNEEIQARLTSCLIQGASTL